ncbi:MAG TPA: hypothetical protein VLR10_01835, partial [Nitrososphaeraceae archaeon]|nr:hypothetical protein [Nitrososphaeraceae archaeon]
DLLTLVALHRKQSFQRFSMYKISRFEIYGILARNYKKCSEALIHRLTIYFQDSVVERHRSGTTLAF